MIMSKLTYDEVKQKVEEYLGTFQRRDFGILTDNSVLRDDIGLDSLDYIQIVIELEEMFGISIDENEETQIGDMNVNTRNTFDPANGAQYAWTHTGAEYLIYMKK